MSEFRNPEVKALLSAVEKEIKEQERKAYVDPEKAEEEKRIGNELFNKGNRILFLIYCINLSCSDIEMYTFFGRFV